MDRISNKKILNIVTVCILLIVPFLKFFSMNLQMFGILENYDNINPAIVLYISVPILLFIYIKDIIDKKRRLDIFDYIFYALIFTGIISTIFSTDKNLAIFGKEFRHEGFLSILSYYLLFINYKINGTKDDIIKFLKLIIIIAILNSLYTFFQVYTNFSFILRYNEDVKMASGMCGNPNFLGSLIVTAISIIICKMFIDKKMSFKDLLISILLFTSLINSQSTGPFLALIVAYIFFIVFLSINKKLVLKSVLIVSFMLCITYIDVYLFNKNYRMANNTTNRCELCIKDIKETIRNGGTGRIEIWENSLGIVKDNYLFGVGFDNFYLAYPNRKVDFGMRLSITGDEISKEYNYYHIVDNAHNVYLHTLVSTGVIGLIPYLLLCLLVFIKGLKSKNNLCIMLLGGFVAYSVQAITNISVVQVAPIYYIIMGLIISIKE